MEIELTDAQRQLIREQLARTHVIDEDDLQDCDADLLVEMIEKHGARFDRDAHNYCENHHDGKVRRAIAKID